MRAVLSAEEHHRMQDPDRNEQHALAVMWSHADDVQPDGGEREPHEPVVRVVEVEAETPPRADEPGDQQRDDGDCCFPSGRRRVVARVLIR